MMRHRIILGRYGTLVLRRLATSNSRNGAAVGSTSRMLPPSSRQLSTATNGRATTDDTSFMEKSRATILESSLKQVHEYGWTEDAIAAGVLAAKLPPTMTSMVSSSDLVSHVMECGNRHLKEQMPEMVKEWGSQQTSLAQRLVQCLRLRLEFIVPYVRSHRWHEAMAIGAMPIDNVTITVKQLDELVTIVCDSVVKGTDHAPLGTLERAAIGAVYATTELHLLTDTSQEYQDTWNFLQDRINDLEGIAKNGFAPTNLVNADTVVAASAVAMSLGGAVLSLAQPAARGAVSAVASTVVPHIATFMQPMSTNNTGGTKQSDYDIKDNLPPFPPDNEKTETTAETNTAKQ